jgi:hypothetical protein
LNIGHCKDRDGSRHGHDCTLCLLQAEVGQK